MKLTVTEFLKHQYCPVAPVESFRNDLSGRTIILTGGNSGLGLECAKHLASMMGTGPTAGRLIIGCRNAEKGRIALQVIREATGYKGGEIWAIDLQKFHSISAFADRFEREGPGHLDLLINNSGISKVKYERSDDGWESTIQVNHLGTALLTFLMLPYLNKAAANPPGPRISFVSSDLVYFATINEEERRAPKILVKLSDEAYCSKKVMGDRYNVSKLISVFFVRALAARLPPTSPVVVNAVNPGFCKSSLGNEIRESVAGAIAMTVGEAIVAHSTEEGGRAIAHAVVTTDLRKATEKKLAKELDDSTALDPKALHGKFLTGMQVKEESDFIISREGKMVEKRLWDETVEILRAADPRVQTTLNDYLQ